MLRWQCHVLSWVATWGLSWVYKELSLGRIFTLFWWSKSWLITGDWKVHRLLVSRLGSPKRNPWEAVVLPKPVPCQHSGAHQREKVWWFGQKPLVSLHCISVCPHRSEVTNCYFSRYVVAMIIFILVWEWNSQNDWFSFSV